MPSIVLILAGGDPPSPSVRRALPPAAMCIAADSGLDHAYDLGLRPEVVVGDLDSVSPEALARAEADGVSIDRHPARKNHTDLELALGRAVAEGPDRIVVAGVGGGRLDHHLANLLVLASADYDGPELDAYLGTARVAVVRSRARILTGRPEEPISLLPVHGGAGGVSTTGLLYPLWGETLHPGSTRGVSNELAGRTASVTVGRGVVLAVQPDGLRPSGGGPGEPHQLSDLGGSEPGGTEGGSAEA